VTETCAFCGATAPASAMDVTGHGLRCTSCAARAQLETFKHGEPGMAEHLTQAEIAGVARDAGREALGGVALAALGVGGFVLSGFALMFGGLALGGFGMVGHGLHRRRQAQRALGDAPDARVVKR